MPDRLCLLLEHEGEDREIAGQPKDRRVSAKRVPIGVAQVVVALVKHDDVVVQVGVVGERGAKGPRALPDIAEVDHGDRGAARTRGPQTLLEVRRHGLRRRHTEAEHRAAAEHDDAALARGLASDDASTIAPHVEPERRRVVTAEQDVDDAERSERRDERYDDGDGGERDTLPPRERAGHRVRSRPSAIPATHSARQRIVVTTTLKPAMRQSPSCARRTVS